ncbi:MAG TPA: S53 family peptidase [Candidatus Dormibacteraeota bacterium]|nr:S53 family peptidase [Candidatus Dormibacteraeota bacterium]
MKFRVAAAALAALVLAGSACSSQQSSGATTQRPAVLNGKPSPAPPTLAEAIRAARDLGPAGTATQVSLNFTLKTRQQARLDALLAAGQTVSAEQYAAEFGPDPALVGAALAQLRQSGFDPGWEAGSQLITVDGPAPAAIALLGVEIDNYRQADGSTFYAATATPKLTGPLAAVVASIAGLDSYRRMRGHAVKPGGLTATDLMDFYNISALRKKNLDGTGQTIMFPEIEQLPQSNINDLNRFATEFGLPPYGPLLTIKQDAKWGKPEAPIGEIVLDLEIAHEIAPNAKLVVYLAAPTFAFHNRAFDQLVTDHLGSVISESLGICELDTSASLRDQLQSLEVRAQAQGMSHFVSTGDTGAYECGQGEYPAGSFPSTLPNVTAVGGTTVFESKQGTYFQEYAWGSPIDESGTGGGRSQFYTIPNYQQSVADASGHGFRQVPDVAADADPITGYHIVLGGRDTQAGGTSASTPLWAATIALINQDLKAKGMREVGFANPALYWMGENLGKFGTPPFHDVTAGNNLAYEAGPGWDFTTGWGSMDAAALEAAWITYIKSGGA